ncbi:MFS transporter [Sandaracinobacteroides saxicola]|uniref:MFS transporter n=1 Tax=Sandaracinobacteroides saxicola TaxID=2759707 RepID=A0A7G5IE73_9SPHN|nr:MFS transporter [Sandaracinobacteroides saxicola]QMW21665.1 MFS transporter [Sandaracinobacteroides saxicola]
MQQGVVAEARGARGARLLWLALLALFLSYVDRGLLPVAGPAISDSFDLSATQFGLAVSAFFWVYAPFQYVSGWLVDRHRLYRQYAGGVALWGLGTGAIALVTGLGGLVAARLLKGLGQAVTFPAMSKFILRHGEPHWQARWNGAMIAAIALGQALSALAGGLLIAGLGWQAAFVVAGAVTLLWLWPWHRATAGLAEPVAAVVAGPRVSYRAIVGTRALWSASAGHFSGNYVLYFVIAWLPLFLVRERGLSTSEMAVLAGGIFCAQAVGALLAGQVADRFVVGRADESWRRKALMIGIYLSCAAALVVAGTAASMPVIALALVLTAATVGAGGALLYAISQCFAGPAAAGRWVGVQNGTANFSGIVGPVITGMLVDATGNYSAAFMLAALLAVAAALCWSVLLPAIRPIEWARQP